MVFQVQEKQGVYQLFFLFMFLEQFPFFIACPIWGCKLCLIFLKKILPVGINISEEEEGRVDCREWLICEEEIVVLQNALLELTS